MTAQMSTLNDKYNQRFFDLLAEELEELFPKGEKCQYCRKKDWGRSRALVLNAYANLFFRQLLTEFGDKIIRSLEKFPICLNCGRRLKPDLKAVNFKTKKWDGHSYKCDCMPGGKRLSIG